MSTAENIDVVHGLKYIIAKKLGILCERVYYIVLVNLVVRKLSAKQITKCLKVDQKRARVETSRSICKRFKEDLEFLYKFSSLRKPRYILTTLKQNNSRWNGSTLSFQDRNFSGTKIQKFWIVVVSSSLITYLERQRRILLIIVDKVAQNI